MKGRTRQKEKGQNSPEREAATMSDCHGGDDALPPDLDRLRAVLLSDLTTTFTTTMKMVVGEALNPISAALEDVKSTTNSLNLKITGIETAVSDHSDRIAALEVKCASLQSENAQLMSKTEDLESRSRRNNIRVIGIPEKAEGADPVKFMAIFLLRSLAPASFPPPRSLTEHTASARRARRMREGVPDREYSLSDSTTSALGNAF
ncbi:hypothetical protein F2P81_011913 [Scophthalmus maximus]|uniref:Uncharacterized protein n=1 Tax=Scophthalmus maximus TaxID=52904 RepID=A0A6A4T024_SCOMX|nr:hypothetical protein F2P81_011913 [Scophthalmus maximus]